MDREDLIDVIYRISPKETPICAVWRYARAHKRKTGGSMRQRRRSMMKPIRFTPADNRRKVHEWVVESQTRKAT